MTTQTQTRAATIPVQRQRRLLRGAWGLAKRKPLGAISLVILVIIWALCLLAPVIAPSGFNEPLFGPRFQSPSWDFLLGTDQIGRDTFSRILYAGRQDLVVSVAASAAGISIALVLGSISAYFSGVIDLVMQRIVDGVQALPGLIVLMVLVSVLGRDIWWAMAGVVVLTVPIGLRIIRANVLQIRTLQYVEAAKSIGASDARIVARHIVPNVLPVVIVLVTFALGTNLLLIAALAFLGLLEASAPSWGTMLNSGAVRFMLDQPLLAIVPGVTITLVVFSYNMLGDALRDVLDPRLRGA